jgi:hypothetical protein
MSDAMLLACFEVISADRLLRIQPTGCSSTSQIHGGGTVRVTISVQELLWPGKLWVGAGPLIAVTQRVLTARPYENTRNKFTCI